MLSDMDSLLVHLRKYRPRENTDPLENFVTEAFAWLLRSSDRLRNEVMHCINLRLSNHAVLPKGDCEISTQENFNGKFPDLVIRWDACTWVFEHKVWSNLHHDQLKNYREYIDSTHVENRIILITAKTYQHEQNPDAALCWQDIYECLKKFNTQVTDEQLNWAINDFLSLLQSEGLGPTTPINRFSMTHYLEAIKFDSQVDDLFKSSENHIWPLSKLGFKPVFKRQKTEGRVGLEFCPEFDKTGRAWLPGIFFGTLLDAKDHGVKKIINGELMFCIVFDFNRLGQEHIKSSSTYKAFKDKLEKLIITDFHKWQFLDTFSNKDAIHNKWHPLIILQPMMGVLGQSSSHDEQLAIIHKLFASFQEKLINLPEFKCLIEELREFKEKA